MIEYLDPRRIKKVERQLWEKRGWSYALDYSWIIQQCAGRSIRLIFDVGCGLGTCSALGAFLAARHGATCIGIDRQKGEDFSEFAAKTDLRADLIFWASSLEHNSEAEMEDLFGLSMGLLATRGLFLATIPVGKSTEWFAASANMVLSPTKAAEVFWEPKLQGDYRDIWQAYREDNDLMDRYMARYKHYGMEDPAFVVVGVRKDA